MKLAAAALKISFNSFQIPVEDQMGTTHSFLFEVPGLLQATSALLKDANDRSSHKKAFANEIRYAAFHKLSS